MGGGYEESKVGDGVARGRCIGGILNKAKLRNEPKLK